MQIERWEVLGQIRPANDTAATAVQANAGEIVVVRHMYICETANGAATYRLFIHTTGTTYDETTAIGFDTAIAANARVTEELYLTLGNPAGSIGVRTSVADALTFTFTGLRIPQ